MLSSSGPSNNELQRTSDGTAAGSPLNSVFCGRRGARAERMTRTATSAVRLMVALWAGLAAGCAQWPSPAHDSCWPALPQLARGRAIAALWTVAGLYALITTSRKLASTLPEERGKRSDDKALARAQNTLGCLGPLLIGTACVVVIFYAHRGTWPWQPWIVAVGGIVGQVSGIAAIEWEPARASVSHGACSGGRSE
jgi:hypothetical protein